MAQGYMTVGCHLSISKGYLAMAQTAVSINANTFQFFTRSPRGGKARAIDPQDIAAYTQYTKDQGIQIVVAHAPYTLNPASTNEKVRTFAYELFADDLKRMEYTPHQYYNFHPGSRGKQSVEEGVAEIVKVLNTVLKPEQTTTVLLETMSGKGTEIGGVFSDLGTILDRIELDHHMGVCLDTCHVWDAGYDIVNNLDGVLEQFDTSIGLDRLKAVHLNDSLNPCGSRKDRHARIGEGEIGLAALEAIINHPTLSKLPFIMETPNDLEGYAKEIALMRAAYHP